MNIINAINSGKNFKRPHHHDWFSKYIPPRVDEYRSYEKDESHQLVINISDLLAEDWEIETGVG